MNDGRTVFVTSYLFPSDSEVSQLASPLMCLMARTIAMEESVTGD
jgi:hypothetical protein